MKSRHNTRQYQPIVNTTDNTSDAPLHARTLAPPVCAAADRPAANMGRGMVNTSRSISGRWCSMAILIVFAAMLAVSILPVCTAADWESCSSNRPIHINNTGGSALTDYQINVSLSPGINATSLRVVNVNASATVYHWNETVEDGNVTELWFNAPHIPVGWCNGTYLIYYGNDTINSASNYSNTFTKSYNTTGLVLELHMDDGSGHSVAVDSSVCGNNGTLTNMSTTGGDATSGWQSVDGGQWDGQSDVVFAGDQLRFDGIDDYVNCGADASLDITDAITISVWMKFHTIPDSYDGIISKGDWGSYRIITNVDDRLFFRIVTGAGQTTQLLSSSLGENTWRYITATYDKDAVGNNQKLYIDGVLDQQTPTFGPMNVASDLLIGSVATSALFNGSIDEVRIYNRSLSEEEIYRQYIRSKYAADAPTAVLGTADAPTVSGVSSTTADGSYNAGEIIAVTVTFNEAVTVTGTPQITLDTGDPSGTAEYVSGTGTTVLTFNYTVQAGDTSSDLDYTATDALALNDGTIKAAGNDALLTLAEPSAANSLGANNAIVIDTTAPTVSGVSSPTQDGSYNAGATISVTVTFNENVTVTGTPQITLDTGDPSGTAEYVSGTGTTVLTFNYTVQAGDTSSDLDYTATDALALNDGTIKDAAGNDALLTLAEPSAANSLGANNAIVIDTTAPTVSGVSSPTQDGSYNAGATISVTVTFNENVTVTGTPQITLDTGDPSGTAEYVSGTGTTVLTFNYTVQAGDTSSDLDYTATDALALNDGTIKDAAGNDALLTLAEPSAANSLGANNAIVIDTTAPTVSGVSSPTQDGSYNAGATISVTVTFNENVTVTGTPQITLDTGDPSGTAEYVSGTGTTVLTFNYTVQAGDTSSDLDYTATDALALNDGTIKDAAGNDALLTLAEPSAANSLGANKAIVIGTTAPRLSSAARDADTQINVTMSEAVTDLGGGDGGFTVVETGDPGPIYTVSKIDVGGSAEFVILTVEDMAESGAAGVDVTYNASDPNGTITDLAGNALETDTTGVTVAAWSTTAPTLDSWTLDIGAKTATLTFSETVNASTLDVTAVTIQDAATATTSYPLTDSTTASSNGASIVIDLSATDFNAIIADSGLAVNKETSWMTITTAAIDDLAGNAVTAIPDGGGLQATTYTAGMLDHINVTPTSASLNISSGARTEVFNATGYDQYNNPKSGLNFTWVSSDTYAGTIAWTTNTTGTFTAEHVGTSYITASNGTKTSDPVPVTVNAGSNNTTVNEKTFTATSGDDVTVTGSFTINVTGWVNATAVGNATNSSEVNQSHPRSGLGSGDKAVSGVIINVSGNITRELAAGNGTIHIEICYNETTLTALGIDASTLAIWKYNSTKETWVKQSSTTTSEGCVYADVKHLCPLGLFGSKATPSGSSSTGGSGGSGGTYPPGWFGTPTVTATKAPAATTTATDAPPGDKVAPAPTKRPGAAKTTTPAAEGTTAETAKNGAPGFTAVFVIAGVLAVAYAMMRRRS